MLSRIQPAVVVTLTLAVAIGCARHDASPFATTDDAWAALRDAYADASTPAQRAEVAERFLAENPTSERATSALALALYPLKDELRDLPRARALAEKVLATVSAPDDRFAIRMMLWEVSLAEGAAGDLREVAAELAGVSALGFGELQDLVDAAVRADQWSLAEEWATAALELATPDAFRADNPGTTLDQAQIAERAARRRAFALAHLGWAAHNLGKTQWAESLFTEAEGVTRRNFVGVPFTPLDRFRAQAALAGGDLDRAEALLAAGAAMGGEEAALALLRQIWEARGRPADGFATHLRSLRDRLARPVTDFQLANADGVPFDLASTRGKVVMLAFWFPT